MTLSQEQFGEEARSIGGLLKSMGGPQNRNRAPVTLLRNGREWNPLPILHSRQIHADAASGRDTPARIAQRHAEYRRKWG
jgi:hypothetical protein